MAAYSPLRYLSPWAAGLFVAALLYTGDLPFTYCRELPAERPVSPRVTLHFVTWKADHPQAWDEAIQRFEQTHPHVRVKREIAPHSSTAYHDLLTQKLRNRDVSLDLFFMDVIWPAEFAATGWALPLDEYFPQNEREKFLPATIASGVYRHRIYGVPSRIDSGMLYYRKDLLEKYGLSPPSTWNELVRQAQTILEGERIAQPLLRGYSGQFKQYEGLVCDMLEFVGSHNGSFLTEDGRRSNLTAPESLQAVRFVREQIIQRLATQAALTYQEPESLAVFVQGNAVFHRNWPYAWGLANDPRHSKIAGQVGVTTLPRFSEGREHVRLGRVALRHQRLFATSRRGVGLHRVHDESRDAETFCDPGFIGSFAPCAIRRPAGAPRQPPVQGSASGVSNRPATTPHTRVSDCIAYPPSDISVACWLFPGRIFWKKHKQPT